jgi:hypothetical protein
MTQSQQPIISGYPKASVAKKKALNVIFYQVILERPADYTVSTVTNC